MGHKFAESFLVASVEAEIVIIDSNPVKHKTNELIRQSATIVGIEKMFAQSLFCKFINLMKMENMLWVSRNSHRKKSVLSVRKISNIIMGGGSFFFKVLGIYRCYYVGRLD